MSQYLIIHCPRRGEWFTEVWDEVRMIGNLRDAGGLDLKEALHFLDAVDSRRYDKLHPDVWVWRLHGEQG